MQDIFLLTKLYIPPAHPGAVERPRLFARLDAGMACKLTLLSAPAGAGKTTLISAWLRRSGAPAAWLSLDERDNDFARFLTYLVAAIQTRAPGAGADALTLAPLHTPRPAPVETALSVLVNDLAGFASPIVLVLDDYHVIQAQAVHAALAFLLDHMPPQMHLYLATRADPPLPLARLRGRAQLVEVRAADLRFNQEETAAFLNRTMGLDLTREAAASLEARTEGWAAGLQMAALSMQGRADVDDFIEAFGGSHRYIADYLTDEVLRRQPEATRNFLLKTAILDRLTGALCDAVCETPPGEGRRMLQSLADANLFVIALDDERRWYRYHRLFADLLRQRLGQTHPNIIPGLHRRASVWYEQHGLMTEAIEHAFAAHDGARAGRLVAQAAEPALMRGENAAFLSWTERLPENAVHAHPALYAYRAWALVLAGSPLETVEAQLAQVEQGTEALRAFVAVSRGRATEALDLARRALESLPGDARFLRSVAAWSLGLAHCLGGDMAAGRQALEQAAQHSRGNVMMSVMTLANLGELSARQGQLHRAQALYRQALELAVGRQGQRLPIACYALTGLGELWREWNDLEAAERCVVEGLERAAGWGETGALDGYLTLARIRQAQGDTAGAQEALQRARRVAVQFDATQIDDLLVAYHQARLWLAQGNLDAVQRWLDEPAAPAVQSYKDRVRARLLLAQGQRCAAQATIDAILPDVERYSTRIELHLVKALALHEQHDLDGALHELGCALALGEPDGYARVFLDEGEPLARLLYEAARRGAAYAGRLLAMFPAGTNSPPEMVEPLSEREIEVLRLVAAGLTNREIAGRLVVSPNTVKKHTINIYSKLNASNRTQAVEKARAFGIL
ncbi:MAG: AAA family ATPase [Anaerolineae bacterium]|nr:AAA family ATPase [Anaerolineae bacterium]